MPTMPVWWFLRRGDFSLAGPPFVAVLKKAVGARSARFWSATYSPLPARILKRASTRRRVSC